MNSSRIKQRSRPPSPFSCHQRRHQW